MACSAHVQQGFRRHTTTHTLMDGVHGAHCAGGTLKAGQDGVKRGLQDQISACLCKLRFCQSLIYWCQCP